MAPQTEKKGNPASIFGWWLKGTGLVAWIGSAVLAGRLVWEETILSWERGPQMIGFSLIHSDYAFLFLFPLILMVWIVIALCITFVAMWRKRQVSGLRWVSICMTILILAILFLPEAFWVRMFAGHFSRGPHAVEFLNRAANTGDLDVLEKLLSHGVPVNAGSPWDGVTPLHSAASGGEIEIVEYLLSKGSNINAINRLGDSPLENALSSGNNEAAKYLSVHGALRIRGDDTQRDSIISQIAWERYDSRRKSLIE